MENGSMRMIEKKQHFGEETRKVIVEMDKRRDER